MNSINGVEAFDAVMSGFHDGVCVNITHSTNFALAQIS